MSIWHKPIKKRQKHCHGNSVSVVSFCNSYSFFCLFTLIYLIPILKSWSRTASTRRTPALIRMTVYNAYCLKVGIYDG